MPDLKYQIDRHEGYTVIHAQGKTRPGLFTAVSHALFEAMQPGKFIEDAPQNQRSFSFEDESSEALLAKMVDEGIRVASDHKEACQELRLNLITDKKVEGSFMACEVTHFDSPLKESDKASISVKKDEATGEWQAEIRISQ
ncbi:MAG: archease [Patescibacteria group bacterium]